jgi:hypothetical protein
LPSCEALEVRIRTGSVHIGTSRPHDLTLAVLESRLGVAE